MIFGGATHNNLLFGSPFFKHFMSVDKWAQVQRLNKGSQLPHEKAMDEGSNLSDMCASVASTGSCDTSIGSATQSAKLIISTEGGSAVVGAGGVPCSGPCDTSIGSHTQSAKLINTTEEDAAVVGAGVVPCEDEAIRDV